MVRNSAEIIVLLYTERSPRKGSAICVEDQVGISQEVIDEAGAVNRLTKVCARTKRVTREASIQNNYPRCGA